jgi:hypothetical protein
MNSTHGNQDEYTLSNMVPILQALEDGTLSNDKKKNMDSFFQGKWIEKRAVVQKSIDDGTLTPEDDEIARKYLKMIDIRLRFYDGTQTAQDIKDFDFDKMAKTFQVVGRAIINNSILSPLISQDVKKLLNQFDSAVSKRSEELKSRARSYAIVYIWETRPHIFSTGTKRLTGHVSMQLVDSNIRVIPHQNGGYISIFPPSNFVKCLDEDRKNENNEEPDKRFIIYDLNVKGIQEAFMKIRENEPYVWSIWASGSLGGDDELNCSGLLVKLLVQNGKLLERFWWKDYTRLGEKLRLPWYSGILLWLGKISFLINPEQDMVNKTIHKWN